jgi:hypothetical protein
VRLEQQATLRRRSIDDPRLSKDAQRLLRCALTHFAAAHPHPTLSAEENLAAVIELYEFGLLRIEGVDDGLVVGLAEDRAPRSAELRKRHRQGNGAIAPSSDSPKAPPSPDNEETTTA